ncbi:hypothetical protein, partial [Hungatella hathewayi]|uniref:hypothetical protein n=1 Tax=Hungatella hathewayi TaxID=154046 RepID=UPI001E11A423
IDIIRHICDNKNAKYVRKLQNISKKIKNTKEKKTRKGKEHGTKNFYYSSRPAAKDNGIHEGTWQRSN